MYYYDGLSVVAEKKKPNGGSWAWDKIYVIAPGVISHIIAESQNTGTQTNPVWTNKFYHYDAIGNVVAHTASDGSLLAMFDQEAYGNVKTIIGSGSQSGYHLTTKESDPTSELYYFYKRWYSSTIGCYISKSPLPIHMEKQYIYVSNSPIFLYDPLGLLPCCDLVDNPNGKEPFNPVTGENGPPYIPIGPPNPYWPPGFPPFPGNNNANKCMAWMFCDAVGPGPAKVLCYILEGLKEVPLDNPFDWLIPGDIFGGWEPGDIQNFNDAINEWKEANCCK